MKRSIPETAHRILSPLALSHRSLLPQGKMLPLAKEWQKSVTPISLSSAFPRKKARTFVLTFEKLSEPSENTLTKQKMT